MSQSSVKRFSEQLDSFSNLIGKSISWLTLAMVLVMTLVVVLRYGFNIGWIWLQESVLYFHALVLMLAMAYTIKVDEHVRVDIFYRRFSKKNKNKVNLIGHLLFLFPTCLFVLFMSWNYVAQSWSVMETSQEAGGLPILFVLKSLLVITPILMIFQGVNEIIKIALGLNKENN